jgi:Tfp pilus assembly protein PilO
MLAALFAVTVIAGFRWMLSPHIAYLQAVQQYEPAMADMVACKRNTVKSLSVKRQELGAIRNQFDRLRSEFFSHTEAAAFLGDLWTLAENAGCTVKLVDFTLDQAILGADKPLDHLSVVRHQAKLVFRAQYEDVITLLEHLVQHYRQVSIDSVRLDQCDGSEDKVVCEMTIALWVISP